MLRWPRSRERPLEQNGKRGERPNSHTLSPNDTGGIDRQADIGIAGQNAFERDRRLGASQLKSEAEVDAGPERQMGIRPAGNVKSVRVDDFRGIAIGSGEKCGHHFSVPELLAAEHYVARCPTWLRHLDRRYVTKAFFDAQWHQARVCLQPPPLILVPEDFQQPTRY